MDKKLQDLAWSILPKEFKEEVKYEYRRVATKATKDEYDLGFMHAHEGIFGIHNLTSDAEGEEMLCVRRKEAQGLFRACNEHKHGCLINGDSTDYFDGEINVLTILFDSKCLPDEKIDSERLANTIKESIENPLPDKMLLDGIAEPKPAKPKFKEGDKARHHDTIVKIVEHDKNEGLFKVERREIIAINGRPKAFCASYWVKESDLEPYTEPEEKTSEKRVENEQERVENKQSRNLSQSMSNCDKRFDNILKDSFSRDRMLNIAVQIMSGILSNQKMLNNLASGETTAEGVVKSIVDATIMYTDALIARTWKGSDDGED